MNISPTPRRYGSRSGNGNGNASNYGANFRGDNDRAYIYSDPVGRDYNGDRIVPEEYKLNSQMINRLIKQNKELSAKLDSKQEEIDRLNILVGSLRGKLIKYTEMNKKLQDTIGVQTSSRSSSDGLLENEKDYIQVPKRRTNNNENRGNSENSDDRIAALSAKLDKLADLVLENGALSPPAAPKRAPTSSDSSAATRIAMQLSSPSEEDIMCRESLELKQMEDQIDALKRKLLIKRENELRKLSLNQELLELMAKLGSENTVEQQSRNPHDRQDSSPSSRDVHSEHCLECHHNVQSKAQNVYLKTDIPSANPLETPTPLQRKNTRSDPDTINRVW